MAVNVIGSGWQPLLEELDDEVRLLDPQAVLGRPLVDADGLLRLEGRFSPGMRQAGKRLLRDYEQRAGSTCELCGGPGRVCAGVVVLIRCDSCRG